MAIEQPGFSISMVAGEDLSAKQHYFVKQGATEGQVVACTAVTDKPIGILQNNPASGQEALVMTQGVSKVPGNAALANGDVVGTAVDGRAATYVPGTDTTKYLVGRVIISSSAANELASVLFSTLVPVRGA